MIEQAKQTFMIRLPEHVAPRIEAQATGLGIAPTTLIQSLISGQFESGATQRGGFDPGAPAKLGEKLDALRKTCELLGQTESERYGQLLFEVVKTRSALFTRLTRISALPSWTRSSRHRRRAPSSTSPGLPERRRLSNESPHPSSGRMACRYRIAFGLDATCRPGSCRLGYAVGGPDSCHGLALDWLLRRPRGSQLFWHLDADMWMLTWFFTEEIPLPFGSVPYRGGRYTIPSMYRFLCYKYYLGGSFTGWFWHYAWWGLFLTLLIMGVIVIVFFGPERDPTEDRLCARCQRHFNSPLGPRPFG
jgi:hypothetical protein